MKAILQQDRIGIRNERLKGDDCLSAVLRCDVTGAVDGYKFSFDPSCFFSRFLIWYGIGLGFWFFWFEMMEGCSYGGSISLLFTVRVALERI